MVANHNRIAAYVIVALGVYIAVNSVTVLDFGSIYNPDAGFLTSLVGLSLIVLGALWAINAKSEDLAGGKFMDTRKIIKPFKALIILLFYAVTFKRLGYVSSTLIFMVAWQTIIERQKWLNTILISVFSTAGMYLLFVVLLKAPLPMEIFLR